MVCACLIVSALAGCGNDGGSAGSEPGADEFTTPEPGAEAFVVEANEICAETETASELYNDEIERAGLQSPESARYLRRAAAARQRGLEQLRELSPPADDAESYEEFIRNYEVNLVKLEEVAAAIEGGDTEEAQRIEEDINVSTEELSDPLAAKLGIDDCASG